MLTHREAKLRSASSYLPTERKYLCGTFGAEKRSLRRRSRKVSKAILRMEVLNLDA
jgi:hypothetical protein